MGVESMNFCINSGSFTFILYLIIAEHIFKVAGHKLALKYAENPKMRLIGMKCEHRNVVSAIVRLILQMFIEIYICSGLGAIDFV